MTRFGSGANWKNKVGAAFVSSGHRAGARETTIMAPLQEFIMHGMVVCGGHISSEGHLGAVATGAPNDQTVQECSSLAKKVVTLATKLQRGSARLEVLPKPAKQWKKSPPPPGSDVPAPGPSGFYSFHHLSRDAPSAW